MRRPLPPPARATAVRGGPGQGGQALVLTALLLAGVVLPLTLAVWGIASVTDTYDRVRRAAQVAADAGATALDEAALAAGQVRLDESAARTRADALLRANLRPFGRRVSLRWTDLRVDQPTARLCYTVAVTIGVLMSDGWGWSYQMTACARQSALGP